MELMSLADNLIAERAQGKDEFVLLALEKLRSMSSVLTAHVVTIGMLGCPEWLSCIQTWKGSTRSPSTRSRGRSLTTCDS